jgi:alpha-L-arabinofuranosidase
MRAKVLLDKDFSVGDTDPRLFGSFIEHLGRAVYGGIYEPGHPLADEAGFRRDVLDLVRELDVPLIRYPGGNYVSVFKWEDSVGPVEARPRRLDLAWRSSEPNSFGLDEFAAWAKKAGAEPMIVLNLGTRGIREAAELVEYCNHPGGSRLSDYRARNGAERPHGFKLWCMGNEMDGFWQLGAKTAEEYASLARETAKAMKLVDPSIELIACGSSKARLASFPGWDATVLERCGDLVDYLAIHSYFKNRENDLANFLGCSNGMNSFIESAVAACDLAKVRSGGRKRIDIAFDEWNVWFHSREADKAVEPWQVGPPLLEDVYTFEDAIVVGCILISLLRHADRVKVACLAQLVNVIAPIMTENGGRAWRQTIYYPFLHVSRFGRGRVLVPQVEVPSYESAQYGEVPYLECVAVERPGGEELSLFLVNKSLSERLEVELRPGGYEDFEPFERREFWHRNHKAANTRDFPDTVVPRTRTEGFELGRDVISFSVPPLSWNLVRFAKRGRKLKPSYEK